MATNPPKGDGHRKGAVRDRSQIHNPHNDRWTKRDTETGKFIDQKADQKPFIGVSALPSLRARSVPRAGSGAPRCGAIALFAVRRVRLSGRR
jgi:hypothetical protein